MTLKGILCALLLLTLLFGILLNWFPSAAGQQDFSEFNETSLRFLEEVVGLNMATYDVWRLIILKPLGTLDSPQHKVDLNYGFVTAGKLAGAKSRTIEDNHALMIINEVEGRLLTDEEIFTAAFTFTKNSLTHCSLSFTNSTVIGVKWPADVLDEAKLILNRYKVWRDEMQVEAMLKMLENLKTIENYTKIDENVKFTMYYETDVDTEEIGLVGIIWNYWENGVVFRKKTVGIIFTPKDLVFVDTWNLYSIGSAVLAFSGEDAVRIAKEAVKNYTYTAADYEGKTVVVGNFTVLDKPLYVDLGTDCRGDYYTLYPFWEVYLCLDTMYLGGVTALRVQIWADTGEVIGIYPTGGLAAPGSTSNGAEVNSEGKHSLDTKAIVLSATIIIITAMSTATIIKAVKRRAKNQAMQGPSVFTGKYSDP